MTCWRRFGGHVGDGLIGEVLAKDSAPRQKQILAASIRPLAC